MQSNYPNNQATYTDEAVTHKAGHGALNTGTGVGGVIDQALHHQQGGLINQGGVNQGGVLHQGGVIDQALHHQQGGLINQGGVHQGGLLNQGGVHQGVVGGVIDQALHHQQGGLVNQGGLHQGGVHQGVVGGVIDQTLHHQQGGLINQGGLHQGGVHQGVVGGVIDQTLHHQGGLHQGGLVGQGIPQQVVTTPLVGTTGTTGFTNMHGHGHHLNTKHAVAGAVGAGAVGAGVAGATHGKAQKGTVTFRPIEGRFNKDKDLVGKMDPYVKFKIGLHRGKSTVAKSEGVNPTWGGEAVTLKCKHQEFVKIKVKDHDKLRHDDTIGTAKFPLAQLYAAGRLSEWIPVTKKEVVVGEVHVEMEYTPRVV